MSPDVFGVMGGVRLPAEVAVVVDDEDDAGVLAPLDVDCGCSCGGAGLRLARLFLRWMRLKRFFTSL